MKLFRWSWLPAALFIFGLLFLNACGPVRNMNSAPAPWPGDNTIANEIPFHDPAKKNVFIIADSKMTVLFDMIAPFYLFNCTGKANVFIISKDHTPILVKRGLFVCPQLTFEQADSMRLPADVIVIPALSFRGTNQDTIVIEWIKNHFSADTKLMAVCDGAATAAATGLYDGKPITCHASDYEGLRKLFPRPVWVRNVAVTTSGNLFSTAGVSNAVEGSLTVINEMFGRETMQKALDAIHYPHREIITTHNSEVVTGHDKWSVAKKILFRKNKKIGLILQDGADEFGVASIIETYSRTFPSTFIVCNPNLNKVRTKYGLTLLTVAQGSLQAVDELHILDSRHLSRSDEIQFAQTGKIQYDSSNGQYPINICLERINKIYGQPFAGVVKKSLDYN